MTTNTQASPPSTIDRERSMIIDRVRRLGLSSSDALLDPDCSIFTIPHVDGLIGYRFESSCAVVYGDPLCAPEDLEQLVCAFHQVCSDKGMHIIYMTASEKFANWAMGRFCNTKIEFGEELVLDPHDDPKANKGVKGSLVRRKVKHALKEGATVVEYIPDNAKIEEAMVNVGMAWLKGRQGPQVHISNIHIFNNRPGKRWFYVSCKGAIVAVVVLHQLQSRKGWLLNHLMFTSEAPHGTPELLLTSALETLASEGCHFVTFGASPANSLGDISGLSWIAERFARRMYWCINKIFHLSGRKKFWDKFQPKSERSYLLFSHSKIGWKELKALRRALNVTIFN
ncbi:MAG: DUF2156 domain-containing protein [Parachlamydiaceae bacterium]